MENSLVKTLKDPDAITTITDMGEVALDSIIKTDVIKDIPILGIIYKIAKVGFSISDDIFFRKLQKFCQPYSKIGIKERTEFITKLEKDEKLQQKVNDNLLIIINSINDIEKSVLLGKVFGEYVNERIDYDTWMIFSSAINNMSIYQINKIKKIEEGHQMSETVGSAMVSAGLAFTDVVSRMGKSSPSYRPNESGLKLINIINKE